MRQKQRKIPSKVILALWGVVTILTTSCGVSPSYKFDRDPRVPWFLKRHQAGDPAGPAVPTDPEAGFSYWNDDQGDGPLKVTIDLSDQAAYFDRGTVRVGRSRVATGLPGRSTPVGSYTITEKTADKASNLYGQIIADDGTVLVPDADSRKDKVPEGAKYYGAPMPNWMRLTSSGIGMHAGPIPNPGSPASHGCIRMPPEMALTLYNHVELGTPVKIVY